jgi:hypothetical protein
MQFSYFLVPLDGSSDLRLLLLTGKRFKTRDADTALAPSLGEIDP